MDQQTLLPPKKRPAKHFSVEDKEKVLNVFNAYDEKYPNSAKTQNVELTAQAVGVSVASVFKILREYKETQQLHPPKEYRRRRAILDKVDDETKNALRSIIHSFLERNDPPSLDKVLSVMNANKNLPQFKRSTLRTLIKEIGFEFTKQSRKIIRSKEIKFETCFVPVREDFTANFCGLSELKHEISDSESNSCEIEQPALVKTEEDTGDPFWGLQIKSEALNLNTENEANDGDNKIKPEPLPIEELDIKDNVKHDSLENPVLFTSENQNKKSNQCYMCNFKCLGESALHMHMKTHNGEKPFQCIICEYKCVRNDTLQRHMRIHTGEKPFKCGVCEYRFRQKGTLQIHMKIHTGEKPFKCPLCDYRCIQNGTLQNHIKSHIGKKTFNCNLCDYKSIQKSKVKRHIKVHSIEKTL